MVSVDSWALLSCGLCQMDYSNLLFQREMSFRTIRICTFYAFRNTVLAWSWVCVELGVSLEVISNSAGVPRRIAAGPQWRLLAMSLNVGQQGHCRILVQWGE